jgi:REP element-mobilizing transposase RayT
MHDRRHPSRLEPGAYRNPGDTVFVTMNSGRHLACDTIAATLVRKMRRMDELCGTAVLAYVIMPDHLHVVVRLLHDGGDIAKWVRYFKREASRAVAPGMWQRSFWDRHMRRDQDEETAILYVLNNPVRKGLCENAPDWPYSWSCYHPACRGLAPRG